MHFDSSNHLKNKAPVFTNREREGERDRQTDSQTERWRERQRERNRERETSVLRLIPEMLLAIIIFFSSSESVLAFRLLSYREKP